MKYLFALLVLVCLGCAGEQPPRKFAVGEVATYKLTNQDCQVVRLYGANMYEIMYEIRLPDNVGGIHTLDVAEFELAKKDK